jgi:hypothetical protein
VLEVFQIAFTVEGGRWEESRVDFDDLLLTRSLRAVLTAMNMNIPRDLLRQAFGLI